MLKKLGITLALAVMLVLPASARVRFGVSIGGPTYYGPAYPYAYTYCDPYYGCYPNRYVYYYGAPQYYWYRGHRWHRTHRGYWR